MLRSVRSVIYPLPPPSLLLAELVSSNVRKTLKDTLLIFKFVNACKSEMHIHTFFNFTDI